MKDALGGVQTALILGGDSDIAIATCNALANYRLRSVILAGRNSNALEERRHELAQAQPALEVQTHHFDALDFENHEQFASDVFEYGDIDLVLVAFGLLGDQHLDERDAIRAVNIVETNFTGAVSVLIPIVERLKPQGHGTVVVLSSVAAERARRSNFIYGASKAGLDWFTQGLGDSLQGTGVEAIIVRPGFAITKMTAEMKTPPMASDADSVAKAIVEGIRDRKAIVWVPGKLRWVMSIIRHLPRPVFRRLPI